MKGIKTSSFFFETSIGNDLFEHDQVRTARVLEAFIGGVKDSSERLTSFFYKMRQQVSENRIYHVDSGVDAWVMANPGQISEMINFIQDAGSLWTCRGIVPLL